MFVNTAVPPSGQGWDGPAFWARTHGVTDAGVSFESDREVTLEIAEAACGPPTTDGVIIAISARRRERSSSSGSTTSGCIEPAQYPDSQHPEGSRQRAKAERVTIGNACQRGPQAMQRGWL